MRLRYTLPALADLTSILDDIAAQAPQGAHRVQARIKAVIDLLTEQPRMGSRTDDQAVRRMTALPYPYLIFYESTATEIIILAVRHAKRDPAGIPGAISREEH